jgi:signal transduction histidine kinase/ActR/RegA family two-component response regulator
MGLASLSASGGIEWINDAFAALTGCTEAQAMHRRPEDLLPPLQAGGDWYQGQRPDGQRFWLRPVRVDRPDGGQWLILVDLGAAALPGAEPALVQMQLATELAGVIIWHHDLASGMVTCSEPGLALLGPPPRPTGWTLDEFTALMHPADRDGLLSAGREALASAGPVDLAVRYLRRDGQWRHATSRRVAHRDAQGKPVSVLGVAMDVTDREAALLELRTASERLALTVRAVGIGTWWYDVATRSSHWDEQMWALRGLTPRDQPPSLDEMLAMVHPDDQARVRSAIDRSIAPGSDAQYDFRVILPDGRERWLASRSVQTLDSRGQVLRRIGVNWDVTDAREAAASRHEKDLALRESRAKSELLARLSHELRTPLNAILGFSQLLLDQDEDLTAEARRERLQHIRSAGAHLLDLINDVLELSRPDGDGDAVRLAPLPLAPLVAQVLPMVAAAAAVRRLRLVADIPPGLVVHADDLRLRQVLLNLATNAIKYNHDEGELRISAREDAGQCLLTVSDTGIGMAPSQIEQAFQPFQRLQVNHPGAEGVGLGLAIVKRLMHRMAGSVTLQSAPGAGTVVSLRLPLAVQAQPAALAQVAAAAAAVPPALAEPALPLRAPDDASAAPRSRRLMYIEDNPVNLMIVAELAARYPGLQFRSAETGEAGIALARAFLPDLLLLDMQLPDGHGTEVLQRLRADPLTRRIPCIALSANAVPEDIQAALGQGFADYWTKPLDFAVFDEAIEALLRVP